MTEPLLIKAGDPRVRLGNPPRPVLVDCRVVAEETYQALIAAIPDATAAQVAPPQPVTRPLSSLSEEEAKTAYELAFPGKEFDCADWDFESEYIIRGRDGETLRIFNDGDMICEKGVYSREFKAAAVVRFLDSIGIALGAE